MVILVFCKNFTITGRRKNSWSIKVYKEIRCEKVLANNKPNINRIDKIKEESLLIITLVKKEMYFCVMTDLMHAAGIPRR